MAQTVRYDALAVFVGPSVTSGSYPSGLINQLHRVQSTEYGIEIQRENTLGLGTANVNDQVMQSPFVNLTIDYLVTDGSNEKALGLVVDGSHGALVNLESGQNDYYMLISKEPKMVLAVGNGMLERYSVNGRIGGFLQATAGIKAFNIKGDEGTSGNPNPRVDAFGRIDESTTYQLPEPTQGIVNREDGFIENNIYIGPKDIQVAIPNNSAFGMILSGDNSSYLQSFDLAINIERSELTRLGEKYPFSRCLKLPVDISLRTEFVLNRWTADRIQNYLCQDIYDIDIDIKSSKCEQIGEDWDTVNNISKLKYALRGLKFKGMSIADSISNRTTVDIEWGVQVGNLLDLQKNLFISGNFGRYAFPPIAWRDVSGEQSITGQGLRPIVREVTYKRTKADVVFADFFLDFSGNFDIKSSDIDFASLQYRGTTGVWFNSGKFGSGVAVEDYAWRSDSYSTSFEGLPRTGYTQKFSNLDAAYFIGYPGNQDAHYGVNYFYTKGEGMNSEPMTFSISNLPTYARAWIDSGKANMDPYEPYYFNILNIAVAEPSFPTGQSFEFDIVAATSKLKRVYTISATTPYSHHINLPKVYSGISNIWIEGYDPINISYSGSNILSVRENSVKRREYAAFNSPVYRQNGFQGKSYFGFSSPSYLQYTGIFREDYTNFTIFALFSGNSSSDSDARLFSLYNNRVTDTGVGTTGYSGNLTISRLGAGQDLYIHASSTSSGNRFIIPSGFTYNTWNIATFHYDGDIIRARLNGVAVPLSGVLSKIGSNYYTHAVFGSGFSGGMAEFLSFPYHMNANSMSDIERYLRYKWGV